MSCVRHLASKRDHGARSARSELSRLVQELNNYPVHKIKQYFSSCDDSLWALAELSDSLASPDSLNGVSAICLTIDRSFDTILRLSIAFREKKALNTTSRLYNLLIRHYVSHTVPSPIISLCHFPILTSQPAASRAHYSFGNFLSDAGRPKEAAFHFARAFRLSPRGDPGVLNNLGTTLRCPFWCRADVTGPLADWMRLLLCSASALRCFLKR